MQLGLLVQRRRSTKVTLPLENTRNTIASQLGDYNLIAPLARGGTAGVYLGEHVDSGARVAVKVLDPFHAGHADTVDRMFAEHTVSQRVRHSGLLEIHRADRSELGLPYLVMEYLDGENLGALADRGPIQIDAILAIGAQIACALGALHDGGYIHCDVKADNVFVLYTTGATGWPKIKVIDFGVARKVDQPVVDATIAGTPAYMAPEQWRGAPTVQSDVYALGCLMYELVTGDQPFHGTLPQLMLAHCEKLPARPSTMRSELPPELERVILRAISKDPAMRPTMLELEAELGRQLRLHTMSLGAALNAALDPTG